VDETTKVVPPARRPGGRRRIGALALALALLTGAACTSDGDAAPGDGTTSGSTPDGSTLASGTTAEVEWLFVLRADQATTTIDDDQLQIDLRQLDETVVAFSDRPNRLAGTETAAEFQDRWVERFDGDPPEAALVAADGVTLVVRIDRFELTPAGATVVATLVDEVDSPAVDALAAGAGTATDGPVSLHQIALFVDGADTGPDGLGGQADPGATPHLDAVEAALQIDNPTSEGIAWSRSTGNALGAPGQAPDAWLLQTPQCWGLTTCTTDSFTRFTTALREVTAGATTVVDVTTLYPYPDGDFRQAIVDGLGATFAAGNRPLIRVTAGVPPSYSIGGTSAAAWRDALAADIAQAAGIGAAEVPLAVASVATSWGWSWNHAKIVAADGQQAIIGGHNLWSADYLQTTNPINDVSLHHRGPLVAEAHTFVDAEWGFICANTGITGWLNVDYEATAAVASCPATHPALPEPEPEPVGDVPVLSIGRLGMGIDIPQVQAGPLPDDLVSQADADAVACSVVTDDYTNLDAPYERDNPGEPALRALIGSAQTSIAIAQQDLIGLCSARLVPKWDVRVFDALAQRIAAGVEVTIVISNADAEGYTNGGTLADISAYLLSRVEVAVGDAAQAKERFCAQVGVAPLRFNDTMDTWPGGQGIGNHTKVVAVDRAAFYVGSQNLYPAWLQEYGVITEDPTAAATFYEALLDPLWQYSQRAKDTSQCPPT
jgi:phosphatidylserine/phosphatidylglycerophosphate/cardiolipin synthase-like enzyme